jgi:hypothetical protein
MFDMHRSGPKKLRDAKVTESCQIKISYIPAALENLDNNADINRISERIGEKIKTSGKENLKLYNLK